MSLIINITSITNNNKNNFFRWEGGGRECVTPPYFLKLTLGSHEKDTMFYLYATWHIDMPQPLIIFAVS